MAFKFDDIFKKCILADVKRGNIPFLIGEVGIGKSSFVEALAAELRTKCFAFAANQLADKADVTGARLVPDPNNPEEYFQRFFPHEIIQSAINYAQDHPHETPILFIDEVNRTTSDVTSELLSIPTLRSIGSKKLPDNLRVVCAGNNKGNITSLDEASMTRFVAYMVEPDVDTYIAVNPELNEFIKRTLLAHRDAIFCKKMPMNVTAASDDDDEQSATFVEELFDDEGMDQLTCPRTLTYCSEWMNEFDDAELNQMLGTPIQGIDGEVSNVLQENIIAHIGRTEFMVYLMADIATNIGTVSNQQNAVKVNIPAVYKDLKAQTDVTGINNLVASMNNEDISGCIVAALVDNEDTTHLLRSLSPATPMLIPTDMQALMASVSVGRYSSANIKAFLDTNAQIATTLSPVLESYVD